MAVRSSAGLSAGSLAARIRLTAVLCARAMGVPHPSGQAGFLAVPWLAPRHDPAFTALIRGEHLIRLRLRPPCSQSPEHLLHFVFHRPRSQLARIAGKWANSRWPVESHRPPQIRRRALPASAATQYGPLAQLVEQETLNLLVVGSIPTRPTKSP